MSGLLIFLDVGSEALVIETNNITSKIFVRYSEADIFKHFLEDDSRHPSITTNPHHLQLNLEEFFEFVDKFDDLLAI